MNTPQVSHTMAEFVKLCNISMTCEWSDSNPAMRASTSDDDMLSLMWYNRMKHYRCTLKTSRRQMTVYFSMGSARTKEPTVADVLDCLAMDAICIDNTRTFEEWAREYGYDDDSRRVEKSYNVTKRQTNKLRAFLGNPWYEELLYRTERL